jgi:hypothetical protein
VDQSSTALVVFMVSMLPDLWNETFLSVRSGALDVRADHRLLISCHAFGTARVSHGARVSGVRFAGSAAAEDSS